MAKIIILDALDYAKEKDLIEEEIDAAIKVNTQDSLWFLLSGNAGVSLDTYLGTLFEKYSLANRALSRLRICKNLSWQNNGSNNVSIISRKGARYKPDNMSELLKYLQKDEIHALVIENNDRTLLADIIQQLIYLNYPISKIEFKLRKEYKDAERVRLFMENIDQLSQEADTAIKKIKEISIDADNSRSEEQIKEKDYTLANYNKIKEEIIKSKSLEMKVAFAASKKTGKSVLVNCLLGQELAPTSLEMATPNTCIYKKSTDNQYHLSWINADEEFKKRPEYKVREDFADSDELFKTINEYFRMAEKDTTKHFALPDLQIEYVSNGNNFSSYTIYDTPGPDAAGTSHKDSAGQAMKECDASVFAIDYSKYLTDSEEKYLGEVKDIFKEKNKFHTLLFTINKMDLALQDSGAKSRVKSIDFIRNRLKDINKDYQDCIIFATSAQDYFNTLTLGKMSQEHEELRKLMDPANNWLDDLGKIKRKIKNRIDERDLTALSNLDAETTKIYDLLDYDPVTLEVMQEFSGMPQIMSYLGYILKSRAREEIVNNIAMVIDSNTQNLATVIAKKDNLLQLVDKNDNQIRRISTILTNYIDDVRNVLNENITNKDLKYITPNGYLDTIIRDYAREHNDNSAISLQTIGSETSHGLKDNLSYVKLQKRLWDTFQSRQYKLFIDQKRKMKPVPRKDINMSSDGLCRIITDVISNTIDEYRRVEQKHLEELIDDLKAIMVYRFSEIKKLSDECKTRLEKEEQIDLSLPELPIFDVSFPEIQMKPIPLKKINLLSDMQSKFKDIGKMNAFFNGIATIINSLINNKGKIQVDDLLNNVVKSDYIDLSKKSDQELWNVTRDLHLPFMELLDNNNINEYINRYTEELIKSSTYAQQQVRKIFFDLIATTENSIKYFMATINDIDKLKQESEKTMIFLEFLEKIKAASQGFMDLWNYIRNADVTQPQIEERII